MLTIHEGKLVEANGNRLMPTLDIGRNVINTPNERGFDTNPDGPRHLVNVVEISYDVAYKYIRCDDGKIFKRSINYSDWSPYGWRETTDWPVE